MIKILLVEDDKALAEGLFSALQGEYEVAVASTLKEAKRLLGMTGEQSGDALFQLILLDLNLPDGDGVDFCRQCKKAFDIPVLMLTARDTEADEIQGLEAGADDYVTKPFRLGILRARIRLLLRREQGLRIYRYAGLTLDFEGHRFWVEEKEIQLSRTEEKVLWLLVSNNGRTLTRDFLIEQTWDSYESVDGNTLSVCITRLKNKIGGSFIRTVYGVGYQWQGGAG